MPHALKPPARAAAVLLALAVLLAACAEAAPAPATPPPPTLAPAVQTPPDADAPGTALPAPTGPYAVGLLRESVTDPAREENHTPAEGDVRELLIEIWYPVELRSAAAPAPYLPAAVADALEIPQAANDALGLAAEGAPPAETGGPLPVIVFGQGFISLAGVYTTLLADLASHGYVVAAVSHPYTDAAALLADGSVVGYPGDAAFVTAWGGTDPVVGETYEMWLPDTMFLIGELGRMNARAFGGRLALEQIGFAGHSYGGGIGAEACRLLADRCAAAANLDGSHPARLQAEGVPAPYLYIAAENTGSAVTGEVQTVMGGAQAGAVLVEIRGAAHLSFGDGPFLPPREGADPARYGTIDPARMAALTRRYVRAFFDRHLLGAEDAPPLADLAAADAADVTVITWPAP